MTDCPAPGRQRVSPNHGGRWWAGGDESLRGVRRVWGVHHALDAAPAGLQVVLGAAAGTGDDRVTSAVLVPGVQDQELEDQGGEPVVATGAQIGARAHGLHSTVFPVMRHLREQQWPQPKGPCTKEYP